MPGAVFLEGDDINLRTVEEEDLEFIRNSFNLPEVRKNLDQSVPQNLEQERDFFENVVCEDEPVNLAVAVEGKMAGLVELREKQPGVGEIGIWLHPDFHGEGYGTEACDLLLQYAFNELGYDRVMTRAFESNMASQRVWEKLGFTEEGRLRNQRFQDGEYEDVLVYGLLREEYYPKS